MKISSLTALIFLVFLVFSSSCTIQKRVHLPGYHVERHQKKKLQNSGDHLTKTPDKKTASVAEQEGVDITSDSLRGIAHEETESTLLITEEAKSSRMLGADDEKNRTEPAEYKDSKSELKKPKAFQPDKVVREAQIDDREMNSSGLAGFILAVMPIVFSYAIFALPVALILSIIGLVQTNREPGRYKGRQLYIAGVAIAASMLIGTVLLLLWFQSWVLRL